MNTIAERIKFAMDIKNVKQAELVKITKISKGAFSSYLSGRYTPKEENLNLIANALDINVDWLIGNNVPMEKNENFTEYVFYKEIEYLINNTDTTYIGVMTQYNALIPRFYIYVNSSTNEIHILPLFLRMDSKRFYHCPPEFFDPNKHIIFTKDFNTINITLDTSQIYYYGIDTNTYEIKISSLMYSPEKKCYIESDLIPYPLNEFIKEVEKEALYLKTKTSH